MKTLITLTLASLLLAACGATDSISARSDERYVNKDQQYSVAKPDGWDVAVVRGSAQFAPKAKTTGPAKHTIVVRAADKPRELKEGKATTNDDLVAATAKVLTAMPRADMTKPQPVEAELPAVRFSLTFQPPGLTTRYRRDHVMLVGRKHVYHVIYTAPAKEPIDESALRSVYATLTEGV